MALRRRDGNLVVMTTDPLFVDVYALDDLPPAPWTTLVSAGLPWCGAVLKNTEGLYYNGGEWFTSNWQSMKMAAQAAGRYGVDFFRGCYHYIYVGESGTKQAQYYQAQIEAAGGWGNGDLWPIVDVENADQPADMSKGQIIDCVSQWAETITAITGRAPMLYGRTLLAQYNITDHMGCQLLWTADLSSTLPASVYEKIGWSRDQVFGWQYCEDGSGALKGYPMTTPIGKLDCSAMIIDDAAGHMAPIAWTRQHLGIAR